MGVVVPVNRGGKDGFNIAVGLAVDVALGVSVGVPVSRGVKDGSNVAVGLAVGVALGVGVSVPVNRGVKDGSNVAVGLSVGVALGVVVSVLVNRVGVEVGISCSAASNHARSLSIHDVPALTEFVVFPRSDDNGAAAT